MLGYTVCGVMLGRRADGSFIVCRLGRRHPGPHL
jgi:hypothetical protein